MSWTVKLFDENDQEIAFSSIPTPHLGPGCSYKLEWNFEGLAIEAQAAKPKTAVRTIDDALKAPTAQELERWTAAMIQMASASGTHAPSTLQFTDTGKHTLIPDASGFSCAECGERFGLLAAAVIEKLPPCTKNAKPAPSGCECGAVKTFGAGRGSPAHATWCPWRS